MKKREAKFQTIFNKYLRESGLRGYFELKQTRTDSIPWSCVESHQMAGLLSAEAHGFVWKLSDEDRRPKPFDCLASPRMPSYVVIKFPKAFYLIPAKEFMFERNRTEERSLTDERAYEIASKVIHI